MLITTGIKKLVKNFLYTRSLKFCRI